MDNLSIYNNVRVVPPEAQKKITGGRLNGMTDINPMWRIKTLTEQFGPCGIGWKIKIINKWTEEGAEGEKSAFVDIELYVKYNGEWSEAIPGTGGSTFVAKEKTGLRTSDECYKMAYTDAISVACKALGFGADVYWHNDKSNLEKKEEQDTITENELKLLYNLAAKKGYSEATVKNVSIKKYNTQIQYLNPKQYNEMIKGYEKLENKNV